jgi:hypothetical protein
LQADTGNEVETKPSEISLKGLSLEFWGEMRKKRKQDMTSIITPPNWRSLIGHPSPRIAGLFAALSLFLFIVVIFGDIMLY